ncbi:hypothetical protein Ccrd_001499 [Cynara cardunculus var. scolymus]|uniref:Uncharacterized protein n=2 Tax=Cynara cardunculus var. scolymus TaxID=59895 RepID=A0A124SDB5_CYNCS|nr:hypothetical protein Ccrd_001499 [Cynara cardunculus var. scolymus]
MRYLWMPRLAERIQAASTTTTTTRASPSTITTTNTTAYPLNQNNMDHTGTSQLVMPHSYNSDVGNNQINPGYATENSGTTAVSPVSDMTDCYYPIHPTQNQDFLQNNNQLGDEFDGSLISPSGYFNQEMDFEAMVEENNQWSGRNSGDFSDSLWNVEDILFLQRQFNNM